MPWDILQLDERTATSRDVKKAYARLLKTFRPEQDPEGFRRVHEAYEFALAAAERREGGGAMPALMDLPVSSWEEEEQSFSNTSEPQTSAPEPGEPEIVAAFQALQMALKSGEGEVAPRVRHCEEMLYAHPQSAELWSRLMAGMFMDFGDNRDLALKPEAMLAELRQDSYRATLQVIERMDRLGRAPGIESLGDLLLSEALATHAAGMVMLRLAMADCVWLQFRGERLANRAYPLLQPHERREADVHYQQAEALGKVLAGMPHELKIFWRSRLTHRGETFDWESEEGRGILQRMKSPAAAKWPGYRFLLEQIPEKWRPAVRQAQPQSGSVATESWDAPRPGSSGGGGERRIKPAPVYQRSYSGGRGGGVSPVLIMRLAVAVLILLSAVIRSCAGSHY